MSKTLPRPYQDLTTYKTKKKFLEAMTAWEEENK